MRTAFLAVLLIMAGPAAAQAIADPPPVQSTVAAGDDGATRMTVPVYVNDQGPFQFVIDTGADRTVISRELANRLGLKAKGSLRIHAMGGAGRADMVKLDSLRVSGRTTGRLNAAALPRAFVGADGLLGIDSLKGQRIIMDFKAKTMSLEPSATPDAALATGGDVIVVTAKTRLGQLVMVDADVNGEKIWVVVDTGAQNSVGNISLRRLMLARNPAVRIKPIEMIDVLGQRTAADYAIVNRLRIGGVLLGNAAIAFADAHPFRLFDLQKKPSMLLGMDSLRSFERVSVDFSARKIKFLLPAHTPRVLPSAP
ncbi:MAG: retroviral-like aspartic protease family protein [Chakrabartia sp.]